MSMQMLELTVPVKIYDAPKDLTLLNLNMQKESALPS